MTRPALNIWHHYLTTAEVEQLAKIDTRQNELRAEIQALFKDKRALRERGRSRDPAIKVRAKKNRDRIYAEAMAFRKLPGASS
jgi:predicted nucleotidyltransferase